MKISHKITKDKEGTYYTLPFDVPENVIKITVSYSYKRKTKGIMADLKPSATIDLGLEDEKHCFLGWSGSAKSTVYVGEHDSTKGYLSEKINPGKWYIIIGAYHVPEEGVEVEYVIEFEQEKPSLLFGDIHIHSDASDGALDTFELLEKAKKLGLDFISLSNHNNFCENYNLPSNRGIAFIPSTEWTHYKGHMNFYGVKAPFKNSFVANNEDDMKRIINEAREMGATISVNHPKCFMCPYLWEDEDAFDMMEIWNGPMRPTNVRGIEYWTELLKRGRKIPAVGGSDFHKDLSFAHMAHPITAVYSPRKDADSILDSIKKGNCFVTKSVKGPKISLTYGSSIMGDTVSLSKETKLKIKCSDLRIGEKIVTVSDKGEKVLPAKRGKTFEAELQITDESFVYIKIVTPIGKHSITEAISNPIYFEHK